MRWSEIERIPCPVAQAMVVIGDSWTVLILRDALRGASKFDEFQRATGASRAIVSERLSHLVQHGVMEREQYEAHPPRYAYKLTERGRALQPVLMMMAHWSESHLDVPLRRAGRRHATCGHGFTPVVTCSECGEEVAAESVTYARARVEVVKS
jgi:DNA-binding HxlR family transcriptional regulator